MRKRLQWLFALLGALVIEAFLSTMIYRSIVGSGGNSIWKQAGELAHVPGCLVGRAIFGVKSPIVDFFQYASGLVIWLLVCRALISILASRKTAEPSAAPNGGPTTPVGKSRVTEAPPSVS